MWSLVLIWRQLDVIKFSAIAFYRTPGYCSLANMQNHVARVVILLLMIFVLTFTFVTKCVTNTKAFYNIDLWEILSLVLILWCLDVINVSVITFYHALGIFSSANIKAILQGSCVFGSIVICLKEIFPKYIFGY
jgi:hypothetical protein